MSEGRGAAEGSTSGPSAEVDRSSVGSGDRDLGSREKELLDALEALQRSHEELRRVHLQLVAAAKMESIGRLAASVAHEVKNPLTVILMGIEFLGKHLNCDEDTRGVLDDMEDAVRRANAVVRGLLDFAAPGKLSLAEESLHDVVERSLWLLHEELTRTGIEVVREFDPSVPPIPLDRRRTEQALANVLLNAIHSMPRGGVLTVRTQVRTDHRPPPSPKTREAARPDARMAVLEVDDTGMGIAEENLGRIFEPFFTTKPGGKGAGLGLTVVQEIVEMHGGTVTVRNREEGGVRAALAFPIAAP